MPKFKKNTSPAMYKKSSSFKMKNQNSPAKCWTKAGYRRKPGTVAGTKGSCYKPGKK